MTSRSRGVRWCGACSSIDIHKNRSPIRWHLCACSSPSEPSRENVSGEGDNDVTKAFEVASPFGPGETRSRAMASPGSDRSEDITNLMRRTSSLKVGKAVVSTPNGWPPGFGGPDPDGEASAQGSTTEAASTSVEPPSTPPAAIPSSTSLQDLSGAGRQGGTPAGGRRLTAKSVPFWERELHKPKGEGVAQEDGGGIGATLSNSATESGAPAPADGESSKQHRRTSSAPLEISPGLLRTAAGAAGGAPPVATRHAPNPNKCSIVTEHLRGGTTKPPARAEGSAAGSASEAVSSRFSFGRAPKLPFTKSFSKLGGSKPKSFSKS